MALAGNQSQNIISTEVLVQRLPIHYDLKIVHVGAWKNITEGEHVSLATTHLYNRQSDNQFVQKVIPYDLEREVQFDPLPEDLLRDVKVNVYDEAGRLDLRFDVGDAATTLISKSVPAIKRLLPRTSIEVSVQGRNDRVLSKVNGDLITVFDRADNDNAALVQRFTKNLVLNVSICLFFARGAITRNGATIVISPLISSSSSVSQPVSRSSLTNALGFAIFPAHRNRGTGGGS